MQMWQTTIPLISFPGYSHSIMTNEHTVTEIVTHAGGHPRPALIPCKERDGVAQLIESEEICKADIVGTSVEPAVRYWDEIRGQAFAPTRKSFRLDELPPKLVPSMGLIEFVDDPVDYLYRFFGSNLVQVSGLELTGKRYFADDIRGYGFVNEKLLPVLIERRAPLYNRVLWKSIRGIEYVTTSIRLPLSDDGERVTGAVTVNAWSSPMKL